MKLSAPPGLSAVELLEQWEAKRLNFYDEFNAPVLDADIWTAGGDAGGGVTAAFDAGRPSSMRLFTNNVINEDYYIQGDGVRNKVPAIGDVGYSTLTWSTRLGINNISDISIFWGLLQLLITAYDEPAVGVCAHFFADPAITNTFRARTYVGAEEETDTLVALDTANHKFTMVLTAASVLFYIDDVLVATHVTRVPTNPMMSEFLVRTEAVAAKSIYIDYLRVELS